MLNHTRWLPVKVLSYMFCYLVNNANYYYNENIRLISESNMLNAFLKNLFISFKRSEAVKIQ